MAPFLVLLLLTATTLNVSGVEQDEEEAGQDQWSYRYTAGGAADLAGCFETSAGTLCPMAGATLCGVGVPYGTTEGLTIRQSETSQHEIPSTDNVGGACTGTTMAAGETFQVTVTDDLDGPTAFGVCVDADEDGLCRPDVGGAEDLWITRHCSTGPLRVTPTASGTLYVFVLDEVNVDGARVCLPTTGTINVNLGVPECADGKDNDGNGYADYPNDPGCDSYIDYDEWSPQCSNWFDDDGDGWTDYPNDPGCTSSSDDNEDPNPQCSDGKDNDGNGIADHPNDPGCTSRYDDYEWSPECSNLFDDDGDGWTDHPDDPGCDSGSDNSEWTDPQCSDGIDNDGNGYADHPNDPGCSSKFDDHEWSPECSNWFDDDGDGWADYPNDPGCTSSSDDNEDPNPQCSDGTDNDGNGLTDYPNDPGCSSKYDDYEWSAACSNGIDDDGDGWADYPNDPGCKYPSDTTENPNPQCSDGIDNDGDGRVDGWDAGCSSKYDNTEREVSYN